MKLSMLIVVMAFVVGAGTVPEGRAGVAEDVTCKDAKAKAAGKRAADVLKAYMRNEKRPNDAKLTADIAKGEARFTKALSRAEARGYCSSVGDGEAIEEQVDNFVGSVLGVISPSCGDGVLAPGEECDGSDDGACPGQCRGNCTCRPCGASGPFCGGTCPGNEICADVGFGCGCVVSEEAPCGGSYPTCDGACPEGHTCGENGLLGCVCFPNESPSCGDAQAPQCDGACRDGLSCVGSHGGCACIPGGAARPCGTVEGPPTCLGGCPADVPICRDVGGSCTCTAYPSVAFLDAADHATR